MLNFDYESVAKYLHQKAFGKSNKLYCESHQLMLEIQNDLFRVLKNNFTSEFDPKMSSTTVNSIMNFLDDSNSNIRKILFNLRDYNSIKLPEVSVSVQDIIAELKQCQQDVFKLEWHNESKLLSMTTHPVILSHPDFPNHPVNFGQFQINLFCNENKLLRTQRMFHYYIVPITPKYPTILNNNLKQYFHPHINLNNVLCEGTGKIAVKQAINQLRLSDFYLLVSTILNTYGQESPYIDLKSWFQNKCSQCGEYDFSENFKKCSYCTNNICSTCVKNSICFICKQIICNIHRGNRQIVQCLHCKQYVCLKHYYSARKHSCIPLIEKIFQERKESNQKLIEYIRKTRKIRLNDEKLLTVYNKEMEIKEKERLAKKYQLDPSEVTGPSGWNDNVNVQSDITYEL